MFQFIAKYYFLKKIPGWSPEFLYCQLNMNFFRHIGTVIVEKMIHRQKLWSVNQRSLSENLLRLLLEPVSLCLWANTSYTPSDLCSRMIRQKTPQREREREGGRESLSLVRKYAS